MYHRDQPGASRDVLLDFLMEAAGRLWTRPSSTSNAGRRRRGTSTAPSFCGVPVGR